MPTTCDGPHAWKMCQQRLFFPDEKTARDREPTTEERVVVVVVVEERERSKRREKTKRNRESERPKSDDDDDVNDDERYPTLSRVFLKDAFNIVSAINTYIRIQSRQSRSRPQPTRKPHSNKAQKKRHHHHARVAFRLVFSSPRSRLDDDDDF